MIHMMSNKGFKIAAKSENISNIKVLLENPFICIRTRQLDLMERGRWTDESIWFDEILQSRWNLLNCEVQILKFEIRSKIPTFSAILKNGDKGTGGRQKCAGQVRFKSISSIL